MKHSKGEWLLDEQGEGISISIYTTERPETIVTVWSEVERLDGLTHEEAEANARLIASAPELLEALKDACERMERARGILNRQDGISNWGMLDTSDLQPIIQKATTNEPTTTP